MATVTSFTSQRILEMAAGWQQVADDLNGTDLTVGDLKAYFERFSADMIELSNFILPQLRNELTNNDNALKELNENVLPGLAAAQEANNAVIENLNTVSIPALEESIYQAGELAKLAPIQFNQDEEPLDGDDPSRPLRPGDIWVHSDGTRKTWDGDSWEEVEALDIADFSLTAKKFYSTTHLIY